jgi:uncharacterized membrane protein
VTEDRQAQVVTVRARRPPKESLALLTFRERVSTTLWFAPTLFVVGSFIASKTTIAIDHARDVTHAPSWLLAADSDAAASLTSTVAAAMLSLIAVVFTTTLVAIQLAGGQYSPRVVRIFVRSRLTHVTMGLFFATFVFALNALVEIRGGSEPLVPEITISVVYLLLASTILAFIAFVQGMSRLLRVQYIYTKVTADGRASLLAEFPLDAGDTIECSVPVGVDAPVLHNARHVGVLQAMDVAGLVAMAETRDVVIEMLIGVGEYIGVGTPIARVLSGDAAALVGEAITEHFLLDSERTLAHDPGFVFRQLADVAVRALSPAVNDPTTAVQAIDRINDLLADVGPRPDPPSWYIDSTGIARLRVARPGLERLILLGYVEIVRFGADSPQVVRRLHAAFNVLEVHVRPDLRTVVQDLRRMLDDSVAVAMPAPFRPVSSVADRHGLG